MSDEKTSGFRSAFITSSWRVTMIPPSSVSMTGANSRIIRYRGCGFAAMSSSVGANGECCSASGAGSIGKFLGSGIVRSEARSSSDRGWGSNLTVTSE